MNKETIKKPYEAPTIEWFELPNALSILASLSAEGDFEEWEDEGEEL